MDQNEPSAFEDDEIMAEIRRYRTEVAERCGHDMDKIAEHFRLRHEDRNRNAAQLEPRRPITHDPIEPTLPTAS